MKVCTLTNYKSIFISNVFIINFEIDKWFKCSYLSCLWNVLIVKIANTIINNCWNVFISSILIFKYFDISNILIFQIFSYFKYFDFSNILIFQTFRYFQYFDILNILIVSSVVVVWRLSNDVSDLFLRLISWFVWQDFENWKN